MIWPNSPRGQRLNLDKAQRAELDRQIGALYEHGYEVVDCYKAPDFSTRGKPVPADKVLPSYEREPRRTRLFLKTPGGYEELDSLQKLGQETVFALDARPEGARFAFAARVADLEKEGWKYGRTDARGMHRRLTDPRLNGALKVEITSPDGKAFPVTSQAQFKLLTDMARPNLTAYVAAAMNAPTVAAALSVALESGQIPPMEAFTAVKECQKQKGLPPERVAAALQSMLENNTPYDEAVQAIRGNYSTRGVPAEEALDLRCRLMTAVGPKNFDTAVYHAGQVHSELKDALRRKYPHRGNSEINFMGPEAIGARKVFLELVEQGWKPKDASPAAARSQVHGGAEELLSLGKWLPRDQDLAREARRLQKLRPAELPLEQAALVFQSVYKLKDAEVSAELQKIASLSPDERARRLAPVVLGGAAIVGQSSGIQDERSWVIVGGVRIPKRA